MPTLRLEDFAETVTAEPAPLPDEERDEELRQSAYEEGYAAGWEDATTACSDARAEREAAAARALQALAQTRDEAQRDALLSLEPLLRQMVAVLLPEIARAALVPRVVEALVPLAEKAVQTPLRVAVPPDLAGSVERLLPELAGPLALQIEADPGLAEGCVRLSAGTRETQVDLSAAVAAIARGVTDFFEVQAGEQAHE
jgi:flagellar assembly protein FliH